MKKYRLTHDDEGLGVKLIKEGYGDLTVKDVNGLEGKYVKAIICVNNVRLKKLIEDPKCDGVLVLADKCDLNTFSEVYKLYGGGELMLCDVNVVKMLKFSICYDDKNIKNYCVNYITDFKCEKIIFELLQNEDLINQDNDLKLLNGKTTDYLIKSGYLLLEDEEYLLKMTIENLERILKNEKLVIMKNETWLLNRLLRWYKYNNDKCENDKEREEFKKEFSKLLKKSIKTDRIQNELISEDLKEEYNKLKEKYLSLSSKIIHIYINQTIKNEKLIDIIFDFLDEEDKNSANYDDTKQLDKESIKSDLLNILSSNEDIKVIEVILIIIIEMRMNDIIPSEMKKSILRKLICEYGERKRNRTLKSLRLFIGDRRNIDVMKYLCGIEILSKMLNDEKNYYCSTSKELLIKYIKELKLSYEEEEEMSIIITDEKLLSQFVIEITSFSYPQSEYKLSGNISIKPSFDGTFCEFSINPSLPDGIILDRKRGSISGSVENPIEKKEYEITCKNVKSEKKFILSIEFVDIKFTELNKSGNNFNIQ